MGRSCLGRRGSREIGFFFLYVMKMTNSMDVLKNMLYNTKESNIYNMLKSNGET